MSSLHDNADQELVEILENDIRYEKFDESIDAHYFKVELINIDANSKLLDVKRVENYISEFLPVHLILISSKMERESLNL
jgi:hypothetical protein